MRGLFNGSARYRVRTPRRSPVARGAPRKACCTLNCHSRQHCTMTSAALECSIASCERLPLRYPVLRCSNRA